MLNLEALLSDRSSSHSDSAMNEYGVPDVTTSICQSRVLVQMGSSGRAAASIFTLDDSQLQASTQIYRSLLNRKNGVTLRMTILLFLFHG